MRLSYFIASLFLCVSTASAEQLRVYPKAIADADLDRIMTSPIQVPSGWFPRNFSDLAYPWPSRYVEEFGQPFNSYAFLQNAGALLALSANVEHSVIVRQQAAFLAFSAEQYTIRTEGCAYITNAFQWGYLWGYFNEGFRGAFMNNVTAYGYVNLYHATDEIEYLNKAHELLVSTVECGEVPLSAEDESGFYWLNEYVFQTTPDHAGIYDVLGYQPDETGWRRTRIYNGHIHALLAFIKYRNATGSKEFDAVIDKSIEAMRQYLPQQTFQETYFSYDATFPIYPDYGQGRAAHLAEGLCKITGDGDLCITSLEMRKVYENKIHNKRDEIYRKAYGETKDAVNRLLE